MKHRPGRRMVVREDDGAGGSIWWKLYAGPRAPRVAAIHAALGGEARSGRLGFVVPEALGHWPEAQALALGHVEGTPMTGLPPAALPAACAAAGLALASLHAGAWHPPRTWSAEDEGRVLARARGHVAAALPGQLEAADRLFARAVAGYGGSGGTPVALHRDFHPGQVLALTERRVAVLDWDDAATGAAAVDVGNFLAHLRLEALRAPAQAQAWHRGSRAFRDAYGGTSDDALACAIASTLLRLAGLAIERRRDLDEARHLLAAAAAALDGR